jgi:tRNA threonylcarbamoyladenosine biosynthesis protein TsaB
VNVLGFDTSTAATTAAVLRDDGEVFEHEPPPSRLLEPPGHARELMPALDRLMRQADLGFGELGAIAVGIGPGGFTGLRIGIATAHGLAQSAGIPLHPVLSLAALQAGIREVAAVPPLEGVTLVHPGDTLPLIDAKRKEIYGLSPRGEPFVGSIDYAIEQAPEGALAAGDGSIRFREALESAGIRVAPGDSRTHVVRSLYICRLAATVQPAPPESVVPCYLRAPDAKPPSPSAG